MHTTLNQLASVFDELDARPREEDPRLIAPGLASYLPFVGAAWPWAGERPRVLVYGMAQNLAGHPDEVEEYLKTENRGLTRLQDKWAAVGSIGIKPWQTMHAQVVAALALRALERHWVGQRFEGCVTAATAYTNVVKWASQKTRWTRHRKATDRPPTGPDYARAEPYVRAEVEALKPDLLLALGGTVDEKLRRYVLNVPIVRVRHSARQVLNNLRGVAVDLVVGPPTAALSIDVATLVERWMRDIVGLGFRVGDDRGTTVPGREEMRSALLRDWLYFTLAERRIEAAIEARSQSMAEPASSPTEAPTTAKGDP